MSDQLAEIDELMASGEVRIPVTSKDGKKTVYFFFSELDGNKLREFRKINGGNGNPKKGRPLLANNYLVDSCYLRVEGLRVPFEEAKLADEKSYFKQHAKGRLLIDIVLGKYLEESIPDTEDLNF